MNWGVNDVVGRRKVLACRIWARLTHSPNSVGDIKETGSFVNKVVLQLEINSFISDWRHILSIWFHQKSRLASRPTNWLKNARKSWRPSLERMFAFFPFFLSLCLVQLYLWWIRARLAGTGARSDGRIENKSDNKSSTFFNSWVNDGKTLFRLQCYYWSPFWTKSYLGTKFSEVRPKYISWRREGRLGLSPFLNKLRQFCLSTPALPYLGIP